MSDPSTRRVAALTALQDAAAARLDGRMEEAESLCRLALLDNPSEALGTRLLSVVRAEQGDAALRQGDAATAEACYREALSLDPRRLLAWCQFGAIRGILGDAAGARDAFRSALSIDPDCLPAHLALATAGETDGVDWLRRRLVQPGVSADDRIAVGFALANVLDKLRLYDEAFNVVAQANARRKAELAAAGQAYDAAELAGYVDCRIAACTPEFFAARAGWGEPSETPVFVVGMPRSGTTQVEQMLASHPAIRGLGESNAIGELENRLGPADSYGDWSEDACRRESAAYLATLRRNGNGALRIVDKTPDNLFHLGLLAVLFPGARVILCTRDPRDVCLSCYFQHFSEPMAFACDLEHCAQRYRESDRMVAHWRQVLPRCLHVVRYETLVAEPEPELRRMLAFLQLDWNAACLSSHQSRRPVWSASLWQVRRPLYTDSGGKWRRYAAHLAPLLQAFGDG